MSCAHPSRKSGCGCGATASVRVWGLTSWGRGNAAGERGRWASTLPAHVYARLHENKWIDGVGAFLTADEVDAIFTGEIPAAAGRMAIGLDVGLTKDRTVLSLVRATADGLLVVDGLETWQGSPAKTCCPARPQRPTRNEPS